MIAKPCDDCQSASLGKEGIVCCGGVDCACEGECKDAALIRRCEDCRRAAAGLLGYGCCGAADCNCDEDCENTETSTLLRALMDAEIEGVVETSDGCRVEPDGRCEHGFRSPLLEAGVI